MKALEAAGFYHGREKYNCAQAVLKTFYKESFIDEELIKRAVSWGGGRAVNGVCGALYASGLILNDPKLFKVAASLFQKTAGSVICREIKEKKKFPCLGCVVLCSQITETLLSYNLTKTEIKMSA